MKTRHELIVATLELLNAIGAGQPPSPEDVQQIDARVDGKLQELSRRGIITTEKDQFDDEVVDPLAVILADMAAPSFGQPRKPESRFAAEFTLREMQAATLVPSDVTPSLYY